MAKHIMVFGLGGTGSMVASNFALYHASDRHINIFAVDTSSRELDRVKGIKKINLSKETILSTIIDEIGRESVDEYYCDLSHKNLNFLENLSVNDGSNGWRAKSNIIFESFLKDENLKKSLDEEILNCYDQFDREAEYEIYVVSSIAGGTGSALLIPFISYVKTLFENKFNKELNTTALLALPNIYKDVLNDDRLVKAYSNAYMTLRELNALDVMDILKAQEDGSYFKLLNKYNDNKKKVLDKVYLFDRIPGVSSIALHEQTITEILNYLTDIGYVSSPINVENKSLDIYSAISLSKVKYPKDQIIDYLTINHSYNNLLDEYLPFVNIIMDSINKDRKEALKLHSKKVFDVDYFVEKIITTVEAHKEKMGFNENTLVGLDPENPRYNQESSLKVNDYFNYLFDEFKNILDLNDFGYLENEIDYYNESLKSDDKSLKRKAIKHLKKESENVLNALKNIYKASISVLANKDVDLKSSFMDSLVVPGNISVITNLLMQDENYLPGVIQVVRLSYLYQELVDYTEEFSLPNDKLLKDYTKIEFDFDLLLREGIEDENERRLEYDKSYSDRLINYVNGKKFKKIDLKLFVEDLTDAIEKIESINFFLILKDLVKNLLEGYKSTFENLSGILVDYKYEVDQARRIYTVPNGSLFYYGCSEEEKEETYQKFVSEVEENVDFLKELDGVNGEVFFECANNAALAEDSSVSFVKTLITEPAQNCRDLILSTEIGKSVSKMEMIEFITRLALDGKVEEAQLIFRRIITGSRLPVKVQKFNHEDLEKEKKILILSNEQVKYITAHAKELNLRCSNVVETLDSFMFMMGMYDVEIHAQSSFPNNEIYVLKVLDGLKQVQVDNIEEDSPNAYYQDYEKAFMLSSIKETPMWNPWLFVGKDIIFDLPFISKIKEEKNNENIVKSIVWGLTTETLGIEEYLETGKNFYYIPLGEKKRPIKVGSTEVKKEEYSKLLSYFKTNEYLTNVFSKKFDNIMAEIKAVIPANTVAQVNTGALTVIKRHPFYKSLRDNLFNNTFAKHDEMNLVNLAKEFKDSSKPEFGILTLSMMAKELFKLCDTPDDGTLDEGTYILYAYALKDFFGEYLLTSSKTKGEINKWIKDSFKEILSFLPEEKQYTVINLIFTSK